MSQKNPVFKKLAALTLSASVCTTAVGATTPAKKKQSNNNIIKYTSCAIAAAVVTGTTAYLAWAKLFVNKVLAAAENLAKELNKETPDDKKVKKLSMEFYKLLHEATEDAKTKNKGQEHADKDAQNQFGQENYASYGDKKQCKTDTLALIKNVLTNTEIKEEKAAPLATPVSEVKNRKIKVNRLRYVDMQKLHEELTNTFKTSQHDKLKSSTGSSTTKTSSEEEPKEEPKEAPKAEEKSEEEE